MCAYRTAGVRRRVAVADRDRERLKWAGKRALPLAAVSAHNRSSVRLLSGCPHDKRRSLRPMPAVLSSWPDDPRRPRRNVMKRGEPKGKANRLGALDRLRRLRDSLLSFRGSTHGRGGLAP